MVLIKISSELVVDKVLAKAHKRVKVIRARKLGLVVELELVSRVVRCLFIVVCQK